MTISLVSSPERGARLSSVRLISCAMAVTPFPTPPATKASARPGIADRSNIYSSSLWIEDGTSEIDPEWLAGFAEQQWSALNSSSPVPRLIAVLVDEEDAGRFSHFGPLAFLPARPRCQPK